MMTSTPYSAPNGDIGLNIVMTVQNNNNNNNSSTKALAPAAVDCAIGAAQPQRNQQALLLPRDNKHFESSGGNALVVRQRQLHRSNQPSIASTLVAAISFVLFFICATAAFSGITTAHDSTAIPAILQTRTAAHASAKRPPSLLLMPPVMANPTSSSLLVHLLSSVSTFTHFLFAPNSLVLGASAQGTSVDPSNNKHIVLGFLRVPGEDTSDRLVGLLAAVHEANTQQLALGYNFTVETFHYPHCDITTNPAAPTCDTTTPAKLDSGVADFIGNMSRFHAVLYPTYAVSSRVISAATALGVPVIDPLTIRSDDYAAENVFLMAHHIETEIAVLVRYMFTAHSCAHTGIVHESEAARAQVVVDAFAAGGYPAPPILALPADAATIRDFYFEDSRSCLFVFMAAPSLNSFMGTVQQDARFVPGLKKVFGWSAMVGNNAQTLLDSATGQHTSAAFKDVYFPSAFPQVTQGAAQFTEAVTAFNKSMGTFARDFSFGNTTFDDQNAINTTVFPTVTDLGYSAAEGTNLSDAINAFAGVGGLTHASFDAPDYVVPSSSSSSTFYSSPSANKAFHTYLSTFLTLKIFAEVLSTKYNLVHAALSTQTLDDLLPIISSSPPNSASAGQTSLWKQFVDVAYDHGFTVGGDYPFAKPIRKCLPAPFSTDSCQCNVITRTVFLNTIDASSGYPMPVTDDASLGQKASAQVSFAADKCMINVSSATFPIRSLILTTPTAADAPIITGGVSQSDLIYSFVKNHNFGIPEPSRTRRVIMERYPASIITAYDGAANASTLRAPLANAYLQTVAQEFEPFIILSSDLLVTDSHILTISQNGSYVPMTDPPLKSRADGWNEKFIQSMPAFADYIHAIVSYYAANQEKYTSLTVIVSSEAEVEPMLKSLHTFQIPMTREQIAVGDSFAMWYPSLIGGLMNGGKRPFVMGSIYERGELIIELFSLATGPAYAQISGMMADVQGTVGLCTSDLVKDIAQSKMALFTVPDNFEVVFPSIYSEWWMPENPFRQLLVDFGAPMDMVSDHPSYFVQTTAYALADQLAITATGSRVSGTTKSAAEILYTARTTSVADIPLGPFSNDTCSDDIIAKNEVDRSCQCNKATRMFRVHSLTDWQKGLYSDRTGRYVYQMTTCGVKYSPLIIKDDPTLLLASSDNSNVAIIVGTVCGGAVLILLIVLGLFYLFGGRNNKYAPKDDQKPFAMAFTDIQASTMLWSRCPAIMSDAVEHHGYIIRKLIKRYDGYEVKTIGDSFMVAFKDVEDATLFAVELQRAFFEAEWATELDQHYKEILDAELNGQHDAMLSSATPQQDGFSSPQSDNLMMMSGVGHHPTHGVGGGGQMTMMNGGLSMSQGALSGVPPHIVSARGAGPQQHPPINANGSGVFIVDPMSMSGVGISAAGGASPHGGIMGVGAGQSSFSPANASDLIVAEGTFNGNSKQPFILLTPPLNSAAIPTNGNSDGAAGAAVGPTTSMQLTRSASTMNNNYNKQQQQQQPHAAPVNAPVDDNEYNAAWHGLRVRVGVHFGFGEIRKDEITQGYDYFGTIVNTAARVEGVGHGGQTLVTEAVIAELSENFINGNSITQINIGPQNLRGLDEKIVLYQLSPSALAARRFPLLRLDVENVVDDTSDSHPTTHATLSQQGSTSLRRSHQNQFTMAETLASQICGEVFIKSSVAVKRNNNNNNMNADTVSLSATQHSQRGVVGGDHMATPAANLVKQNTTELMFHYQYINALFATSTESFRRDTLKHLAARWQITVGTKAFNHSSSKDEHSKKNDANAALRMKVTLQILMKAMLAMRGSAAAATNAQQQMQAQQMQMSHMTQQQNQPQTTPHFPSNGTPTPPLGVSLNNYQQNQAVGLRSPNTLNGAGTSGSAAAMNASSSLSHSKSQQNNNNMAHNNHTQYQHHQNNNNNTSVVAGGSMTPTSSHLMAETNNTGNNAADGFTTVPVLSARRHSDNNTVMTTDAASTSPQGQHSNQGVIQFLNSMNGAGAQGGEESGGEQHHPNQLPQ